MMIGNMRITLFYHVSIYLCLVPLSHGFSISPGEAASLYGRGVLTSCRRVPSRKNWTTLPVGSASSCPICSSKAFWQHVVSQHKSRRGCNVSSLTCLRARKQQNNNDGPQDTATTDVDANILIRVTESLIHALTRPTAIASLPAGVVLALVALPFTVPLSQTVLTLVLFAALSVLGRLASRDPPFENQHGLQEYDNDMDEINISWTDTFALFLATSSAYLVLPPTSATNFDLSFVSNAAVGLGLLGATVLVLSQTSPSRQDQEGGFEENINGINGELLNKWDEEMKIRETHSSNVQKKEDD